MHLYCKTWDEAKNVRSSLFESCRHWHFICALVCARLCVCVAICKMYACVQYVWTKKSNDVEKMTMKTSNSERRWRDELKFECSEERHRNGEKCSQPYLRWAKKRQRRKILSSYLYTATTTTKFSFYFVHSTSFVFLLHFSSSVCSLFISRLHLLFLVLLFFVVI